MGEGRKVEGRRGERKERSREGRERGEKGKKEWRGGRDLGGRGETGVIVTETESNKDKQTNREILIQSPETSKTQSPPSGWT